MPPLSEFNGVVRIEGIEELRKQFDYLPKKLFQQGVMKAAVDVMKPIVTKVKTELAKHKDSGALIKSIAIVKRGSQKRFYVAVGSKSNYIVWDKVKRYDEAGRVVSTSKVGILKKPSRYFHFFERGTKAHDIGVSGEAVLVGKTKKGGLKFVKPLAKKWKHPGIKPEHIIQNIIASSESLIRQYAFLLDAKLKEIVMTGGLGLDLKAKK